MDVFRTEEAHEWEAYIRQNQYPLAVQAIGDDFTAIVQRSNLPRGITFFQMRVGRSSLARTSRLVRSDPSDDLLLLIQLTGAARITQGDDRVELAAGFAAFFDPSQPYVIAESGGEHLVVVVSRREVLGPNESAHGVRLRPIRLSALPLRVLRLLAEEVISGNPRALALELDGVAGAATDLLRSVAVLASAPNGATLRPIGREAVSSTARAYILDHLDDQTLSVESVAGALHVSVRHLTASFSPGRLPWRVHQTCSDGADSVRSSRPATIPPTRRGDRRKVGILKSIFVRTRLSATLWSRSDRAAKHVASVPFRHGRITFGRIRFPRCKTFPRGHILASPCDDAPL